MLNMIIRFSFYNWQWIFSCLFSICIRPPEKPNIRIRPSSKNSAVYSCNF